MDNFLNLVTTQGEAIFGSLWPLVWALVRIVIIVLPMFGCVAYLTLWERKLIGWMHIRLGPNRVGPLGLLQPIADALKLLMKEIIPSISMPSNFQNVIYDPVNLKFWVANAFDKSSRAADGQYLEFDLKAAIARIKKS